MRVFTGLVLLFFGVTFLFGFVIPFVENFQNKKDMIPFIFMGFIGIVLSFKGLSILSPKKRSKVNLEGTGTYKESKLSYLSICAMIAGIVGAVVTVLMWLDVKLPF